MNVLALIPARAGSKGIPDKNFNELAGISPVERAYLAASSAGIETIVVSSDSVYACANWQSAGAHVRFVMRPPELATDETAMVDVVKHALSVVSGPEDEIIVLLQPTQPLRTAAHVRAAIELLKSSGADSVVSVVELPATHHALCQCCIDHGRIVGAQWTAYSRRQELGRTFIRDGTVYAFYRRTVTKWGHMYGEHAHSLIIDPSDTTPLDTPADWARAEELLRAR